MHLTTAFQINTNFALIDKSVFDFAGRLYANVSFVAWTDTVWQTVLLEYTVQPTKITCQNPFIWAVISQIRRMYIIQVQQWLNVAYSRWI